MIGEKADNISEDYKNLDDFDKLRSKKGDEVLVLKKAFLSNLNQNKISTKEDLEEKIKVYEKVKKII